ncbi:DUF6885 family protein [Amycolatopsis anabasis]|uniref:DUF6885 family protein n=1 Tax=Amycolatopsis anabasis TaxID=1840409 RepID=UPI00131C132B|nr:hypothetical protein [Amycolatopsis anabasis]
MGLLEDVRWFPGAADVLAEARAEMPQKNELCGAFVTLVCLRANGITVLDQDEAALAAGTVVLAGGEPTWPVSEKGRDDYRLELPSTTDPRAAGSSAAGVARAVETLSGQRLRAVPASGEWAAANLERLLSGVHGLPRGAVIANVATAEFAAQDTPDRAFADYLDGGLPPLWTSRWRVGHFVLFGGTLSGTGGVLVSVVDTYPTLGRFGVHLQPVDRLAAALRRDGMTPGGLLLVVPAEAAAAAAELVADAGLRTELWDRITG